MMATEKTKTPGIYKVTGKKGRIKYRLYVHVQVADPIATAGFRWKLKNKTYPSYQAAVDAKVAVQGEIKRGTYTEPTDVTLRELIEAWLKAGETQGVGKRGRWKIQTALGNRARFERHVNPNLGDVKVSKLRKSMIEQSAAEWQEATSARTANKILDNILHPAFKWALKDPDRFGVRVNIMETVHRLSEQPKEINVEPGAIPDYGAGHAEHGKLRKIQPHEVLSKLELKKLIDAAAPGFERAFLMVAIFCGLRHGEVNALRWSCTNLKARTLTVDRSLTQLAKKHGGPRLEKPKRDASERTIEIPAPLLAELRQWKLASVPNAGNFVFTNPLGKPVSRKENNAILKACCERAGVKPVNLHNLRHSYASQQLINGTTPLEVAKLMGHSSPQVTLSVYAHWIENQKSQAQERLANGIMEAEEEEEEGERGEAVGTENGNV